MSTWFWCCCELFEVWNTHNYCCVSVLIEKLKWIKKSAVQCLADGKRSVRYGEKEKTSTFNTTIWLLVDISYIGLNARLPCTLFDCTESVAFFSFHFVCIMLWTVFFLLFNLFLNSSTRYSVWICCLGFFLFSIVHLINSKHFSFGENDNQSGINAQNNHFTLNLIRFFRFFFYYLQTTATLCSLQTTKTTTHSFSIICWSHYCLLLNVQTNMMFYRARKGNVSYYFQNIINEQETAYIVQPRERARRRKRNITNGYCWHFKQIIKLINFNTFVAAMSKYKYHSYKNAQLFFSFNSLAVILSTKCNKIVSFSPNREQQKYCVFCAQAKEKKSINNNTYTTS